MTELTTGLPTYELAAFPTSVGTGQPLPTESDLQDSWVSPNLGFTPYNYGRGGIVTRDTAVVIPGTTPGGRAQALRDFDRYSGAVPVNAGRATHRPAKRHIKFRHPAAFDANATFNARRRQKKARAKRDREYDRAGRSLLERNTRIASLLRPVRRLVDRVNLKAVWNGKQTRALNTLLIVAIGVVTVGGVCVICTRFARRNGAAT